jgi:hypothetical protein
MTELQARMNNGQPALNGGQAEEAAVGVAEQTRKAAVGTAEAAPEGERQGPGTIVGLLQMWTGRLVGIPFTLLAGGDKGAVLSGKAWVDDTFELAGALSAAQGQYVDRVLAVQHRVVGQFVDSSWTLATTAWKVARRTPAHDPADG